MSAELMVTAKHNTTHWPLRCMSYKVYLPKPWTIALVWYFWFMPIKDDLHCICMLNEHHNDDHSVMPTQDAKPDDYAWGTKNLKNECIQLRTIRSFSGWICFVFGSFVCILGNTVPQHPIFTHLGF